MPTIKVSQIDHNSDGKIDSFRIKVNFKTDPSKVRNIQLFGTFDYFVQKKIKMQLVGMLHMNQNTPNGVSKIISDGELKLEQKRPILIDSITRSIYDVDPFTDTKLTQFSVYDTVSRYRAQSGKFNFILLF